MRAQLIAEGILDERAYVVIAGPANTYSHYVSSYPLLWQKKKRDINGTFCFVFQIATLEEYAVQRYEGASTLYGQCTGFLFLISIMHPNTHLKFELGYSVFQILFRHIWTFIAS